MVGSKLTYLKWFFGQVEHGGNWNFFLSNFLVAKSCFLIVFDDIVEIST
jgi:hypothetical protein